MTDARTELRRVWRRSARWRPRTATAWIVLITVAAYVVQVLTRGWLQDLLQYAPLYSLPVTGAPFEPWRMLTSALLHQPVTSPTGFAALAHILFNMIALVLFGRPLEGVIGPARLVAVYVLGALGGSVGVLYASFAGLIPVNTAVYGASGAVFAVLGAVLVVQRRLGVDPRALLVLIAINLAFGFVVPGIAWQAHIGGLVTGAAVGAVFIRNRGPRRAVRGRLIATAVAVVLTGLALAPAAIGV